MLRISRFELSGLHCTLPYRGICPPRVIFNLHGLFATLDMHSAWIEKEYSQMCTNNICLFRGTFINFLGETLPQLLLYSLHSVLVNNCIGILNLRGRIPNKMGGKEEGGEIQC